MKFCNKYGKENNQDSKFCNGCGNKFDNDFMETNSKNNKGKKSKTKTILITLGIVVSVIFLVGIVSVGLFIKALGNVIDGIKDKIDTYEEKEQTREKLYDSIPKELFNKGLLSKDLKFVNYKYGWGMEWTDKTDKYYFYIDSNDYNKYKNYWLEGIDKSQYRDKYNEGLATYGDYVFKAINVNDLSYTSDVEYGNVHLSANKTYYLVQIYDEAIYYEYVRVLDVNDETEYNVYSASNCKEDSISKEYIFHQENDKWIIEELTR